MFVCLFVCLLCNLIYSQQCGFESLDDYQSFQRLPSTTLSYQNQRFCINIVFRIVRNNDGTNSYNVSNIPNIVYSLNLVFNPHNIYINELVSYDFINSSDLNNNTGSANIVHIPNAINIICVSNYTYAGIAFLGNAISPPRVKIKKSALISQDNVLAHEIAHCLDLKHTHQCSYYLNPPPYFTLSCAEHPNGSNGVTAGDEVADTPADRYATPQQYIPWNINLYNPDKTNIMSYYLNAKDHFTIGQANRMKNAIVQNPYLQSIRSYDCAKINGSGRLCIGNEKEYFLTGTDFNSPSYNWSVTNNLQIIGSSSNSNVTIRRINTNGPAIMNVLINGTISKTKRVRCSFWGFRIIGVFDWVSKDYGNMGLIAPVDIDNIDEEDPTVSYLWEIKENLTIENLSANAVKPHFIGNQSVNIYEYSSQTNQAVINWGNMTNSYLISCYEITQSGERYLISENFVDVGDPKNNPCFKNDFQAVIVPNPVREGKMNVLINKSDNISPCNYRNLNEPLFFNDKLDKIDNLISVFDYFGNQIYSNFYYNNEFTIENLNLVSGNNYVVNIYTNEGGFSQKVIIVE